MGTPNSQTDLLRTVLLQGSKVTKEVWKEAGLDIEVLERVYSLLKPRMKYLRGYQPLSADTRPDAEESKSLHLVSLAVYGGRGLRRFTLKVHVTRKGSWIVSVSGPDYLVGTFGELRVAVEYMNKVVADIESLELYHCGPPSPEHTKIGHGSIALVLAEYLIAALEESVRLKQADIEIERDALGRMQVLMGYFDH